MDLRRVKELKLADPFRPFYVLLENGRRVFVEAPECVGVAPDGSHMGVSTQQGDVVILTPNKVKDLDVMPVPLRTAD